MRKFLIGILLSFGVCNLFGQTETASLPEFSKAIGFDGGASSGWGISYRYWPGKWGVQFNALPYVSPKTYHVSLGVTVLNTIFESNDIRFYLYYGNHLLMNKFEEYNYFPNPPYEEVDYEEETRWITGIGPGFEYFFADRLGFNVRFGLGYYYHTSSDWLINLDGGMGLFFRF
ncbi:MAG: hypothetical protein JXR39_00520 [Marinilabiliaceae bacterium]|nr:hypothetical protein [Marinilabiliaceae bacterium]